MANPQQVRKVGAHSIQETRPCDSSSPRPTVAPDSQPPPTGRKRKHRTRSSEHQASQTDSVDHPEHQAKRHKSSTNSCSTSPSSINSSWSNSDRAERNYWDTLSKVGLSRGATRELNRRNALLRAKLPLTAHIPAILECPKDITHFARHGGPDLSDIRQYSKASGSLSGSESMPSRGGRKSSGRKTSNDTETTRRSSAYTPEFAQKLVDSGISRTNRGPRAANHQEWNEVLTRPRPSLSPSRMSDGHYDRFVNALNKVENEDEVMSHVFPPIAGDSKYPSRQNVLLGNLDPLAPDIVTPQPDYYQGHAPEPGNRQLRQRLWKSIVPSSHEHYPFLPNFFAEAKGPDGSFHKAQLQACHDGALGARAMHRVQNLGRREEIFDNKARTASVTYHGGGYLDVYNHHLSQPRGHGTPSQTHMTQLRSFALRDTPGSFRQGVGAFRNASDYAHQHREELIEDAHRRNGIVSPEPPTIARRSTRRGLSCQSPVVESSDADSSEEGESDDGNYRASSRAHPKGKLLKPNLVAATPKGLATRSPSSGPMTRQRRAMVVSDFDPNSSSEEEPSRAHGRRQQPKPKVVTISPKGGSRRDSSPQRRVLRPRRGSRRP